MDKFTIEITETLQKQVDIEAESYLDAIDKVDEMYNRGEIVLDHSNYIDHEIEEPVGYAIVRQMINRYKSS